MVVGVLVVVVKVVVKVVVRVVVPPVVVELLVYINISIIYSSRLCGVDFVGLALWSQLAVS